MTVSIVITVSFAGENFIKKEGGQRYKHGRVQLGQLSFFLKGYVAILDDDDEQDVTLIDGEDVSLQCPSLLRIASEYTKFGRGRKASGICHRFGTI